jgi:hypothetical protein
VAQLSDEQGVEIRQMLGEGLSPRDVADSIGRVAGLDAVEVLELESAVEELAQQLADRS